jgi:hypothetical protein
VIIASIRYLVEFVVRSSRLVQFLARFLSQKLKIGNEQKGKEKRKKIGRGETKVWPRLSPRLTMFVAKSVLDNTFYS